MAAWICTMYMKYTFSWEATSPLEQHKCQAWFGCLVGNSCRRGARNHPPSWPNARGRPRGSWIIPASSSFLNSFCAMVNLSRTRTWPCTWPAWTDLSLCGAGLHVLLWVEYPQADTYLIDGHLFSNSCSLSGIDMWLTPWAAKTSFSAATKSRQDPWCRSSHCRTHTVRSCSAKKTKPKRGLEMATNARNRFHLMFL